MPAAPAESERPALAVDPPPEGGGLRALVALAASTRPFTEPGTPLRPGASLSGAGSAIAPFVAERMQDDWLAERIDRVLRAEARRQGIDVEGVSS